MFLGIVLAGFVLMSYTGFAADSVQILYKCGATATVTGSISPSLQIVNNGTTNIRLSDLTIRYWYTDDTNKTQVLNCDYAAVGAANLAGTFVKLASPITGANTYCEISFNQSAGILGLGENSGDIQLRIHADDYTNMEQGNDYSFNATASAYVANPKITAYFNGVLIFGTDPVTGVTAATPGPEGTFAVTLNIDPSLERAAISPYIYGSNQPLTGTEGWTARRSGGNRLTGYNWENNASSAGSDWNHSSDNFIPANEGVPAGQSEVPGIGVTYFHDKAQAAQTPYTLLTLQMAGYVAKDKNGTVTEAETAPSSRWVPVLPAKGSAFSLTPDLTDNAVYMDEFVNFLVNKYGNASTSTGVKGYDLDNEPALWQNTHPRIHPSQPTCAELISKSVSLSKAVKNVDPYAEIFGSVAYGFAEYSSFQSAPDWTSLQGNYSWFLDYFLDQMKQASTAANKRLLDVLDVHWYPEAYGGGSRITFGADINNINCNKARIQAPRTLWDPTYLEKSWISQWFPTFLPLIPRLKSSIDTYYPGTKLAMTEFNYGGDTHISGGIAIADVLGIFGKYGMYLATYWQGDGDARYVSSAYKLYRNYDGAGSTYGDTKVKADTTDVENSSVYGSIVGGDDTTLHLIVINKNYDSTGTFNFRIAGVRNYTSARIWAFDSTSNSITERTAVSNIANNSFSYSIPKLTVCHFVLRSSGTINPTPTPVRTPTPVITGTPNPVRTPSPTVTTPPAITATPTPIRTATPRQTATPRRTATPRSTATAAVTATPTPVTATATPGATPTPDQPMAYIKVQFYNQNTAATSNQIYVNFRLINSGGSAIALANIKIRYYYTVDGARPQNFYCDYTPVGSSNVTGAFTTMATAKTGADTYLEIGFTSGAGSLAGGGNVVVQARFAKNDWTNYTQTNDYSFNSSATAYVDWNKTPVYVSGAIQWGTEP